MATTRQDRIVGMQGDLTEMQVDAIVNAANNDLQLGGGVAGAIRRKGGDQIQKECDRIGTIALGEAAVTSGGSLKAKYVIHAASMRLGGFTTPESLRASVRNSFRRAKENQIRTLAFPAIGTGIAGFPMRECAEIMLEEAAKHFESPTPVERIYFVLYDSSAMKTFEDVWQKLRRKFEKS